MAVRPASPARLKGSPLLEQESNLQASFWSEPGCLFLFSFLIGVQERRVVLEVVKKAGAVHLSAHHEPLCATA